MVSTDFSPLKPLPDTLHMMEFFPTLLQNKRPQLKAVVYKGVIFHLM